MARTGSSVLTRGPDTGQHCRRGRHAHPHRVPLRDGPHGSPHPPSGRHRAVRPLVAPRHRRAGARSARIRPGPAVRHQRRPRRPAPPLVRGPRLRLHQGRCARTRKQRGPARRRARRDGDRRRGRGGRVAGPAALVQRPGRHVRDRPRRPQRTAHRRADAEGAAGRRHGLRDGRPVRQRRDLPGRRGDRRRTARRERRSARRRGPPAGPAVRRGRMAHAVAPAAGGPLPSCTHLAEPSAPRPALAARLGGRGPRGRRGGGTGGGRLARSVPRHRAAARRATAAGARTRADRPLAARVPGQRPAAGAGDRVPAGDAALVGPLAEG